MGLGLRFCDRHQHARVGQAIPRPSPIAAHGIETQDQVLGEVAPGGHVWAVPGRGCRALARGKHPRRFDQVFLRNARPVGGVGWIKICDDLGELLEPLGVLLDELAIVQFFGKDHVKHSREQAGVFARARLQKNVCVTRGLVATGVDHDQLLSAFARVGHAAGRICARDRGHHGYGGVGSDQHPSVGFVVHVAAAQPAAVQCVGDVLARLIDGGRRKNHARAVGDQPAHTGRSGGDILIGRGSDIYGDRARAVFIRDRLDAVGNLVHRLLARNVAVAAVGSALLRMQQAIGVGVLAGQVSPARTGEAPVDRISGIALNPHREPVGDVDQDRASRVTEAADRVVAGVV